MGQTVIKLPRIKAELIQTGFKVAAGNNYNHCLKN